MYSQAASFLVTTLGGLFALALLMRFMLQLLRISARNEFSSFLAALTNFVVRPARRLIPRMGRFDPATLALAWLTEMIRLWLTLHIEGAALHAAAGKMIFALAGLAAVHIARWAVYIVMAAVVMQAVQRWVHPHEPQGPLLVNATRPFWHPFQRFIPVVANIADWSPFAVLLVVSIGNHQEPPSG